MAQLPALPQELYQQFAPVFGQLSFAQQSAISEVAHSVLGACEAFVETLLRFSEDMHRLTSLLLPHSPKHRAELVALFHSASSALVQSFLEHATLVEMKRLLSLVDCFEGREFGQLVATLEDIGYPTLMRLLTAYPRPTPCHMCSVQREKTEDYLLINDMRKMRRAPDVWHADHDELIQFDLGAAQVLYRGVCIDLANTCQGCLDRIHRCLADVGRHQELWHLPPGERLKVESRLRKEERQAAKMFQVIHRSQTLRECKEWMQQIFERVRLREFLHQKSVSEAAEAKRVAEGEAKIAEAKQALTAAAMKSDLRAKALEVKHTSRNYESKQALARAQLHPTFRSTAAPYPPGKLSFGVIHHTADGIPLTPAGASTTFGHATIEVQDRTVEIAQWKKDAMIVDRKLEIARARKENNDAAEEAAAMNEYVAGRLEKIELKRLVARSQAADRQVRLLEERRRKKELYMLDMLKALAREENQKMQQEEKRMRLWALHVKQRQLEEGELARMRAAEEEQTRIDGYWGIPTLIAKLRKEDYDRQHQYEVKVENMRRIMATMGRSKHTRWQPQTDVKVRFTDELISYSAATP